MAETARHSIVSSRQGERGLSALPRTGFIDLPFTIEIGTTDFPACRLGGPGGTSGTSFRGCRRTDAIERSGCGSSACVSREPARHSSFDYPPRQTLRSAGAMVSVRCDRSCDTVTVVGSRFVLYVSCMYAVSVSRPTQLHFSPLVRHDSSMLHACTQVLARLRVRHDVQLPAPP